MRGLLLASMVSLTLICDASAADAPDFANLEASARVLDMSAHERLGIGIRAVSLLIKASSTGYMPVWSLEKTGDLALIEDLAAKGYVTISRSTGFPDHSNEDAEFLRYVATAKGDVMIAAFIEGAN
jgi:hypothetical protein